MRGGGKYLFFSAHLDGSVFFPWRLIPIKIFFTIWVSYFWSAPPNQPVCSVFISAAGWTAMACLDESRPFVRQKRSALSRLLAIIYFCLCCVLLFFLFSLPWGRSPFPCPSDRDRRGLVPRLLTVQVIFMKFSDFEVVINILGPNGCTCVSREFRK